MSRAALVVGAVAASLALGVAAAWFYLVRDTADPVTVDEAVTSFRTDTEPTPGAPSPIREGVYVYATRGFETTDALTGVTHRYPKRSTISVRAADCGASLLWRVLDGRSTEWIYCVTPEGWMLASQDEHHTFFGRTERTTYVCTDSPIKPAILVLGGQSSITCTADGAEEVGITTVVKHEVLGIGGVPVAGLLVRKRTSFSGEIRGTARHDIWFDSQSGVPVKIVMVSRTTNDSPVGDVHYEEVVTLRLTSLTPRR